MRFLLPTEVLREAASGFLAAFECGCNCGCDNNIWGLSAIAYPREKAGDLVTCPHGSDNLIVAQLHGQYLVNHCFAH